MNLTAAHPSAFWLAPLALALLLLFRLLRAKRKHVAAGSLLIWKRLAAQPVTARPKRVIVDLSLILQLLAIAALIVALASPSLQPRESRARTVLLVLDNGSLSRARNADGRPAFAAVIERAKTLLDRLNPGDRIILARTAPQPAVLGANAISSAQAIQLVSEITPALSGPDAASIWLFAADRARSFALNSAAQSAIVSLQPDPTEAQSGNSSGAPVWLSAADADRRFDNVAIVEAGSVTVDSKETGGPRVLVRVANFSDKKVDGAVLLEELNSTGSKPLGEQPLSLNVNEKSVAAFRIARDNKNPLRLSWHSASKSPDGLPEDDSVVLAPRPEHAPRIRFHTPHPVLEKLFRLALDAGLISPSEKEADTAATDLDVYIGSVPDRLPDNSRAALFVAPERGYRSFFDAGEKALVWPVVQRGADSPLNVGIPSSDNSGIGIPKAFELLQTGDFTTLLRDAATGRALAARFVDEKSRPCYVLAFSPGNGFSDERAIDAPLAALLVRMALEASHAGPPYARVAAADLEAATNAPLALDWRPVLSGNPPNSLTGSGVLDERASDLRVTKSSDSTTARIDQFLASSSHSPSAHIDFAPWLIVLALVLAAWEFVLARED